MQTHTINDFYLSHDRSPIDLRVIGDPTLITEPYNRFFVSGSTRSTTTGNIQAGTITSKVIDSRHPDNSESVLISGGSRGTQAKAIRTAIHHDSRVIVVLGTGLDSTYPPEHTGLFDAVVDTGGALVSMFEDDQQPRPGLFPQRNELIATLCNLMIVIECARRSASAMIATALSDDRRNSTGRYGFTPVYALPAAYNAHLDGTNHLIRYGNASMLLANDTFPLSWGSPAGEGVVSA